MRTIAISLFFLLIALSGLGVAQASKLEVKGPGKGAVTQPLGVSSTLAESVYMTRTIHGRPADLDPRIPWLEDMGMAQSGGPDPFIIDFKIPYPFEGGPESIVEHDNRLAVINAQPGPNGEAYFELKVLNKSGELLWSRSLPNDVKRSVFWSNNNIYAVPLGASPNVDTKPTAQVFNINGLLLRNIQCPLTVTDSINSCNLKLEKGTAIWERDDGTRISIKLGDDPLIDQESVLLPGDLGTRSGIMQEIKKERERYANGKIIIHSRSVNVNSMGYRPVLLRVRERRMMLAKPWEGHELEVSDLPRYRPNQPGGILPSEIGCQQVVPWGQEGEVIVFFVISNPMDLPESAYDWGRGRTGVMPELIRIVLVHYRKNGKYNSYLVFRSIDGEPFIQQDSIYTFTFEGNKSWLVRWKNNGKSH